MTVQKRFDYYTPTQLLEKNPFLKKIWDVREIGYLLMLKLVRGKKLKRGCLVSETDVLKIFNFCFSADSA